MTPMGGFPAAVAAVSWSTVTTGVCSRVRSPLMSWRESICTWPSMTVVEPSGVATAARR